MSAGQQQVPRATRFPLNLPVRFRPEGEIDWSYGMTVNVSSTGVLLKTDWISGHETRLDVEIVLSGDGVSSTRVSGRGVVVRRIVPEGNPGDRAFAVALPVRRMFRAPSA